MERSLQNLLGQINDLESKNQMMKIQIQDIIQTTKNMDRTETELNSNIAALKKEYDSLESNEKELRSEIERMDILCTNIEASLINETVSHEVKAQRKQTGSVINHSNPTDINSKLDEATEAVKTCVLSSGANDDDMETLLKLKADNFILNQLTIEDMYEIYEKTKDMNQDSTFRTYCKQIATDDYKNQCYFQNATHLLNMMNQLNHKLKETNQDEHFNIPSICVFFGATKEEPRDVPMNVGLAELNKLLLSHKRHY